MADNYNEIYRMSIDEPEDFWANAAQQIHWYKKWDVILDESDKPFYKWF